MKTTFKLAVAIVIVIASLFVLNSCKTSNTEPNPNPATEDVPLTDAQSDFLKTLKDTIFHLEDIVLDDGQNVRSFLEKNDPAFLLKYPSSPGPSRTTALSPREQKNMFLARMFTMGNYLVDRTRHTYASEGADKPAQTGLAYSWGSKDYDKRQAPPVVRQKGCNKLKIYGLDCTGMIYTMTNAADLPMAKDVFWVENISHTPIWTNAFKASTDYKDLKMTEKGQLTKDKMKNGDIILWGAHVGVYLYGWFYQSNGNPDTTGCYHNLESSAGPRCISVTEVLKYGLGSYKVFRASYGEDYTLTIAEDWSGFPTQTICALGKYADTTVINITVTPSDSVIMNYISNSTPATTFIPTVGCDCLGISFINGSIVEYTNFKATTSDRKKLVCQLTYTYCAPTSIFQCPNMAPITVAGQVYTGNIVTILDLLLPQDPVVSVVYPHLIGHNGTLTVNHDR